MSEDSAQRTPTAAPKAIGGGAGGGAVHAVTSTTLRVVGAVALVAATAAVTMPAGLPAAAANAFASLSTTSVDGVWRADGHGTVVVVSVRNGRLQSFDTTAVSCLPGFRAGRREGRPAPDGTVGFSGDDGRPLLTVRRQGVGEARMRFDGAAGDVVLRRLPVLPAGCAASVTSAASAW